MHFVGWTNKDMEFQLGLALTITNKFDLNSSANCHIKGDVKKRSFDEAFDDNDDDDDDFLITNRVPQTLPLFREDNHMDKSDDDDGIVENGVTIGWPPIKSCRKKLCHHKSDASKSKTSLFVKVQVEGVAIARKVDLTLHFSYEALTDTLLAMFDKYQGDYKLTYLDKEGDWLLAGDLPWGSFIRSVQRLKLIKRMLKSSPLVSVD